ncbi:MAG: sodium:solute symporter family protein [Sedimentisphaerales bacterium]
MNLHVIDWCILFMLFLALLFLSILTKRYVFSVSDFLAANRCAGRYLLATAEGVAGLGLITIIAYWEMYYNAGFTAGWWSAILGPVALFLPLTGWVTYRYRETRAMTMAQFFEMRYSRKFRIFAGILAWASGIVNYGIFPGVSARCIIYLCGLPIYSISIGGVDINVTLAVVMLIIMSIAVFLTFMGGQITIIIADFFQGQVASLAFLLCALFLIKTVSWNHLFEALKISSEHESMLNPFETQGFKDFNIWYFVMSAFMLTYGYRAWQGSQGFNCSAKTAHEARMAGILGYYRGYVCGLLLLLVPVCTYAVLHSEKFVMLARDITASLSTIPDTNLRQQMTVPMTLTKMLPAGLLGLVVASLIAAAISCDNASLHSWGSILIQDVLLPLRKKPLTEEQHLKWLRISIISVAVFAWTFSMLFPLKEYIFMFFQITGAIYLGGAGAVIIGGLYWKRGTTAGAWWGMCMGSFLAVSSIIIVNIIWPYVLPHLKLAYPQIDWLQHLPAKFPLNGMKMAFGAALMASVAYAVVSLLTKPAPDFDMDKLLHRGRYAVLDDQIAQPKHRQGRLKRFLGISDEFTFGDKLICAVSVFLGMFNMSAFLIGTILYIIFGGTEDTWIKWWKFQIGFILVMSAITVAWLLWGGIRDFKQLFVDLDHAKRNRLDDGTVDHKADIDQSMSAKAADISKEYPDISGQSNS